MFYLFNFFYSKLYTYCCRKKEEGNCCDVDHNWRHMWLGVQYVCEYNIPLRFFGYTLYNIYIYMYNLYIYKTDALSDRTKQNLLVSQTATNRAHIMCS